MKLTDLLYPFAFLPVCLLLYYVLPKRCRNAALLAASLLFFAWGTPEYLVLLFGLPLVDFVVIVLFSTMDGVLQRGLLRELYATVKNTAAVFSTEAVVLFVVKMADFYSRKNFGYACVTFFCLSYLMRVCYKWYYQKRIIPKNGRSLLVIAAASDMAELRKRIEDGCGIH